MSPESASDRTLMSVRVIMDSELVDSDGNSGDNDSSSNESSEETFDMV